MENLIKLKMTEQAQAENKSQVVLNTFVEACLNLDASIFEPLIEEDQLFQDLDKYRFLQTMKNIFDYMKAQEIEKMELKMATCQGCQHGHITHEFHHAGRFKFAYILYMENDVLKDIFRCNLSTNEPFSEFPF